jgi:hypothetical protein
LKIAENESNAMKTNNTLSRSILAVLLLLSVAIHAIGQTPLKSHEFVPGSWTLALLPDTQVYSESYPGLFTLQTHWIAKNKDKYDIRYVIGLGDITNHHSKREWIHAREAMSELDGKVPYALATGNHDYQSSKGDRKTLFAKYFPLEKFQKMPTFGGTMKDDPCNTYHLFSAGGTDWILFALEWAPRDETVRWANDVLAKHPRRKAILATHAYLYNDGTRYDYAKKKDSQAWSPHKYLPNDPVNDGEELWQKLVGNNNFALTFNGHVLGGGLGFLASKNDRGKTVYQMLVNYQMRILGGEAYLRLIEFLPDGKSVHVKSYSPLNDSFLEETGQQFSFELD